MLWSSLACKFFEWEHVLPNDLLWRKLNLCGACRRPQIREALHGDLWPCLHGLTVRPSELPFNLQAQLEKLDFEAFQSRMDREDADCGHVSDSELSEQQFLASAMNNTTAAESILMSRVCAMSSNLACIGTTQTPCYVYALNVSVSLASFQNWIWFALQRIWLSFCYALVALIPEEE